MSPGLFFLRFHMQFAVTNIGVLNPGFLKTQMTTPTCTFISSLLKVLKPAPPAGCTIEMLHTVILKAFRIFHVLLPLLLSLQFFIVFIKLQT